MSREDPLKVERDFSATLDENFPIIEKLEDYKEAINKYLVLEKQTRQSSDLESSKRIVIKIVETLSKHNDWDYLAELITILSKKHGQLKSAIQAMIKSVIDQLDNLDDNKPNDLASKIKVIETVRTITDKKIFVEVERAVVSRILASIYLDKYNDLEKAIETLCELQVETYSLMPFDTKIDYILEQIKLTLQNNDFAQAKILSRKILLRTLKGFDKADLYKSIYLRYLVQISVHESDYISIVKNLLLLIDIPLIIEDNEVYKNDLISIIYYVVLSPYDNYQSDLIHKIKSNPIFAKNVDAKIFNLLEIFTTNELIHWSDIESGYSAEFAQSAIFKVKANLDSLQKRCIEHDLRVISKYYQAVKLDRLSKLLQLSQKESESYVSELVNKGMIFAKINRPQGIIKFDNSNSENHNDLLNEWCYDVDKLLEEVDSIGHLINKEEMMHGIKQLV